MLFSIITPCNKQEKRYIHNLDSSLHEQTYHNFEWIISAYRSKGLDSLSNKYTRIVHAPQNTLGSAQNEAIKSAQGIYLVFVNAKDYLKQNALFELAMVLQDTVQKFGYHHNIIYDLNPYPTRQSRKQFLIDINKNHHGSNPLPVWNSSTKSNPAMLIEERIMHRYISQTPSSLLVDTHCLKRILQMTNRKYKYQLIRYPEDRNLLFYKAKNLKNAHWFARVMQLQGKVIPVKIIRQNYLSFDNTAKQYSNFKFMTSVLQNSLGVALLDSYYYFDVDYPNLVQVSTVRYQYVLWSQAILDAYNYLTLHRSYPKRNRLIGRGLTNYATYYFLKKICRAIFKSEQHTSKYLINTDSTLESFSKVLKTLKPQYQGNFFQRHILRLVANHKYNKAIRTIKHAVRFKKL